VIEINRALEKKQLQLVSLSKTGDGENEKLDLRGFPVSVIVRSADLVGIDFSESTWCTGAAQMILCRVERCDFVSAVLTTNVGARYTDCDFTKANLKKAVLRGTFTRCLFAGANMGGVIANSGTFIECAFTRANLKRAHLLHCTFTACDFDAISIGMSSFGGSRFKSSRIRPEDLGDTILNRTEFTE
jgi:uncharacterized protein YjbI with pentapeptide repeats